MDISLWTSDTPLQDLAPIFAQEDGVLKTKATGRAGEAL